MFCQLGDINQGEKRFLLANSLSIETNNLKKSIWRFHKVFQIQIQIFLFQNFKIQIQMQILKKIFKYS